MIHREVRKAPDAGIFNARRIPTTVPQDLPDGIWWRLAQKKYPTQFFPNANSRLTPSSMTFPCVYLGSNYKTIVGEVYGDRFSAAQKAGRRTYSITTAEASGYTYLRIDTLPTPLVLCNLMEPSTLDAVGIDGSTLYTTDLTITQEWAERIANHPAHFDGIVYPSRHTFQHCLVLWSRPGAQRHLEQEMVFTPDGDFIYSKPAYESAAAKGLKLAFV